MKLHASALVAICLSSLTLAGCEQTDRILHHPQGQGAAIAYERDNLVAEKLENYTQAQLILANNPRVLSVFCNAAHAKENRYVDILEYVDSRDMQRAVELYMKGMKIHVAGLEALDTLARDNVLVISRLRQEARELDDSMRDAMYTDSQALMEKNLKGQVEADFGVFLKNLAAIEARLFDVRKTEYERVGVLLERDGRAIDVLTYRAILNAQEVLLAIRAENSFVANPQAFEKGDAVLYRLEETLAAQRKSLELTGTRNDKNKEELATLNRILTSFVGNYRDLRQHGDVDSYVAMYRKFNDALVLRNNIYAHDAL